MKIKPMDCPTWDGRYRTFPRFKKMWEENIATRHEDTALHYMLCQSLPKSILDNISTLSNSAEDIWKYLDNKFGKSDTVAREVMGELMSLDHKKLGMNFMGKFSTMLMDTHALLLNINELEWLVSNCSVAELEDRLPYSERVEWARCMSTVEGASKFEKFKNFLLDRKAITKNMASMGADLLVQVTKTSVGTARSLAMMKIHVYLRRGHQGMGLYLGGEVAVLFAALRITGKMNVL